MNLRCFLTGCLLCLAVTPAAAEFRIWTNSGNRKVEAEFAGLEDGQVRLKLRNGSIATVPIESLSAEDQNLAAEFSQAAPTPIAPPANPSATPPAKNSAWPRTTGLAEAPQVVTVTEDVAARSFVYRTANFEFRCDAKLGADVVREFAHVFEGTLQVNRALPLDLKPKPEEGQERFVAQFFANKDDYHRAGGPPGSGGVYAAPKDCILCPTEFLGLKQVGKRFAIDRTQKPYTLIHEVTHQMMNHWLSKLPTWYVEGSAEYVTAQKYQKGRFSLIDPGSNVRTYLAEGRDIQERQYTMWHLDHIMAIDQRAWAQPVGINKLLSMRNYISVVLLTYYFYHVDGAGDAAGITAWLRAIEAGGAHEALTAQHLLRGRSHAEIEGELAKAMRKHGLDLEFTGAEGSQPAPGAGK